MTTRQPVDPFSIPCPACNARPRERCTAPTDTSRRPVNWYHHARADRAQGWGTEGE